MNVTDVIDIESNYGNSVALKAGDKIVVQGFKVKFVEGVGSEVAEIKTTTDRKSTRLNSSHVSESRMPSSA